MIGHQPARGSVRAIVAVAVVLAAVALPLTFAAPRAGGEDQRTLLDGAGVAVRLSRAVKFVDLDADTVFHPVNHRGWWGHIDQNGDLVVWFNFDWADHEYDGMIRVVRDGRTGFLNRAAYWQLDPMLQWADRFSEGVAVVRQGNAGAEQYGLMDKTGRLLVPLELKNALRMTDGMAAVQVGTLIGFVNRAGDVVIKPRFTMARSFHEGLAAVRLPADREDGPLAFIDRTGQVAHTDADRQLRDLDSFHEGLAAARSAATGQVGFLDKRFTFRIPPRFDDARQFSQGVAAVRIGDHWGYIDKTGVLVVEPRFTSAQAFTQDAGLVEYESKRGFINRMGGVRVPLTLLDAQPFHLNFAPAVMPDAAAFVYVRSDGSIVWNPARIDQYGIHNARRGTQARLRADLADEKGVSNNWMQLPEPRDPVAAPYQPEYRYEDRLPKSW
jgi:hypothetical protein